MVNRIISGGQTGADQGALVAGRQLGIATGGMMPKDFRTEAGPCPAFAQLYGMREHDSPDYPPRTRANVRDSDATIWIGPVKGYGYLCTKKAADLFQRPFLQTIDDDPKLLREWLETYNVRTLNVAGPSASHDPLAHRRAAELLIAVLSPVEATP